MGSISTACYSDFAEIRMEQRRVATRTSKAFDQSKRSERAEENEFSHESLYGYCIIVYYIFITAFETTTMSGREVTKSYPSSIQTLNFARTRKWNQNFFWFPSIMSFLAVVYIDTRLSAVS